MTQCDQKDADTHQVDVQSRDQVGNFKILNEIKERKKLAQLVNDVLSILVWGSSKLMTTWQLKQVMTKK